jgi:nucleoid DNA-binding protein
MAEEVKAIRSYTPRVKLGNMVDIKELVSFIQGRTSFNEGAIINMLTELRDAIIFFNLSGRPVRLRELGIFAPRIDKNGRLGINFKIDKWLKSEMNVQGKYNGDIVNQDMIGKSIEEMVQRWNQEHPDDEIKFES